MKRRSRCGKTRGFPVLSSHFSPGLAPQVGQRTLFTCLRVGFLAFIAVMMRQSGEIRWSILNSDFRSLCCHAKCCHAKPPLTESLKNAWPVPAPGLAVHAPGTEFVGAASRPAAAIAGSEGRISECRSSDRHLERSVRRRGGDIDFP